MSNVPAMAWGGATALGGIMTAFGQQKQGKEAKSAYEYNAQLEEQQAGMFRQSAALDEYKAKENLKTLTGQQIGAYAGSGVVTTAGSPIEVMKDTMKKNYLDMAINKYNSEISARSLEEQAKQERRYGETTKKAQSSEAMMTLLKTGAQVGPMFL